MWGRGGSLSHVTESSSPNSVHDDVGLDVEQEVVVATANLQQQGHLLRQCLQQVGGARQRPTVQLHYYVTASDPAPFRRKTNKQKNTTVTIDRDDR